jgi:hypothetical protein
LRFSTIIPRASDEAESILPNNESGKRGKEEAFLITRILKSILLSSATYNEVAEDNDATLDAVFLVIIYVLAVTIPNALNYKFNWILIALTIPLVLLEWLAVTGFTYFISDGLFHGEGSLPGLFRSMGFSVSAGIFYLLAAIPVVGILVNGLLGIIIFIANVLAVRAAMKIGFGGALVSLILANFIASLLLGCLTIPLILLIGPETLINNLEQLR